MYVPNRQIEQSQTYRNFSKKLEFFAVYVSLLEHRDGISMLASNDNIKM